MNFYFALFFMALFSLLPRLWPHLRPDKPLSPVTEKYLGLLPFAIMAAMLVPNGAQSLYVRPLPATLSLGLVVFLNLKGFALWLTVLSATVLYALLCLV